MNTLVRMRQGILVIGDIAVLYFSLLLTLIIRYQKWPTAALWQQHWMLFSGVFAVWLVILYIAELYAIRSLKNNFEFNKRWAIAVLVNAAIAMAIFYFLPFDTAFTPKTNLILLTALFGGLGFAWRRWYNLSLRRGAPENNILLIGGGASAEEVVSHIQHNPQLGYAISQWLRDGFADPQFQQLTELITTQKITLIIVPAHLKKDSSAARVIYQNIVLGIEVLDLAAFYSLIFQKVPLAELEEVWFLENLTHQHRLYESIKRPFEVLLAILFSILFFLPGLIIAATIKLTSAGPVFFRQIRLGRHEKEFTLYKFRSMRADAEKNGPQWSTKDDPRRTAVGKFLRFTHLDEIPQLINLIKGDISFVGPRPERPEFVAPLTATIPYYDLRHLIRPGLTGWAQINYRYGASVEDAYQKLQYDIYYLKNYSFWLDMSILIKTVRLFFTNNS